MRAHIDMGRVREAHGYTRIAGEGKREDITKMAKNKSLALSYIV